MITIGMVSLGCPKNRVDGELIIGKLKEKAVPPEISSMEFVRDLITAVPTSANVKYYANIVKDKSTLRRLIRINEEIANECYLGKSGTILACGSCLRDDGSARFSIVETRFCSEFDNKDGTLFCSKPVNYN